MTQRFCTVTKEGHNRYSVYIDGLSYSLRCLHVKGDVSYRKDKVDITEEEYKELYEAYLNSDTIDDTDNILRAVAGYIFWKKTK